MGDTFIQELIFQRELLVARFEPLCLTVDLIFRPGRASVAALGAITFMNERAILFHLKEAKEELDSTIAEIADSASYDIGEFRVAMGHIYHHLNTAWNGRDASADRHHTCAKNDFNAWRKFPADDDLYLD
jgi:hypothetical protein